MHTKCFFIWLCKLERFALCFVLSCLEKNNVYPMYSVILILAYENENIVVYGIFMYYMLCDTNIYISINLV
jgi:hypothetical protein